ncbi:iron-dicitrate transporter subunit FecD [Shigella flexneri 2a]|nr:iron-dicitrate transporter subunit FecD [Shigella flexneri 2a]
MKIALVIFITLALAGCALLSLHMGVIPVPWRALLTDWQAGREHYYVLMEYRLPRLLLALFVGAALAVAGVLIQGIVRNPLAWRHGGVDITEDAGKDPPADEAGAHRRGAFCMLGQPDGLSDALAPAGCEQRPAVADRQLMGP